MTSRKGTKKDSGESLAKRGLELIVDGSTKALVGLNNLKPQFDKHTDRALIHGTGNLAYILTAINATPLLEKATEYAASVTSNYAHVADSLLWINDYIHDHQLLTQTIAAGAMTLGLKSFNNLLRKGYELCTKDTDSQIEQDKGGSIKGWVKSLALAGALASLVPASIDTIKGVRSEPDFVNTGELTSGGYTLFDYEGSETDTPTISQDFDDWDELLGDNCRNTGYRNVRTYNDGFRIAADCREGQATAQPTEPTLQPLQNYTKIDYNNPTVQRKLDQGKVTEAFLSDVEGMCSRLDMHCMGLLSIMDFETVGSFRPDIKNPRGSASGLIQFTSATANMLGTTTSKLRSMTQQEQLKYVEDYFEHWDRPHIDYSDPTQIALTIFHPNSRGKGDDHPIGIRGAKGERGVAYRQNSNLDKNRDGIVTSVEYIGSSLKRGYI